MAMSRTTIKSILVAAGAAVLLASVPGVRAENLENGEKLYKRNRCETCHGPTLEGGGGGAFPSLVTSGVVADKAAFVKVLTEGKGNMPSFKENAAVMGGMDDLYAFVKSKHK